MIQIKSTAEIATMRRAGLVVGRTLEKLQAAVAPGVTTADLDDLARQALAEEGASSSFLGYHGFPAVICASVNQEIVHGIPHRKKVLREGDVISLDFGAIVDGYHGDAAVTVPVGEVAPELRELLRVCEEALWRGIAAARLDGRLSDISHAIESFVRSQPHPGGGEYGIVEEYVGHGIGTEMHQDPQVHNYVGPRTGHPAGPRAGAGRRAHGQPGHQGHPGARRRLDGGDPGRGSVGAFRAHLHAHRRRSVGADRSRRRRCAPVVTGRSRLCAAARLTHPPAGSQSPGGQGSRGPGGRDVRP
jgi:methionine aminopeptidase type I